MPQMSPLMWELLNLSSVILILSLTVKIYWVNFTQDTSLNNKSLTQTNKKTINWLW